MLNALRLSHRFFGLAGSRCGAMRHSIQARDVPPKAAARRLGMNTSQFEGVLPNLLARGFPKPDPDTGNFDLHAIDKWCDARHSHLFNGAMFGARDAAAVADDRIAEMKRRAS